MSLQYRSVADLTAEIKANLWRIPCDISMVVGIPRSGLLAASLIALFHNLPICTVQEFTQGLAPQFGRTRKPRRNAEHSGRVLLVDDSIWTGASMASALAQISTVINAEAIVKCAIYGIDGAQADCDLVFEFVDPPRYFEWNLFHRKATQRMGFDIDGVLCCDPSNIENDYGPEYEEFLKAPRPLIVPSHPIGGIASNRLAKYEPLTRQWLHESGIAFTEAFFHAAATAQERRQSGDYVSAKAQAYSSSEWILFIESDRQQAEEICRLTEKPVYCYATGEVFHPRYTEHLLKIFKHHLRTFHRRFKKFIAARTTNLLRP
jgi:uncharacterized HAD superfamily protein